MKHTRSIDRTLRALVVSLAAWGFLHGFAQAETETGVPPVESPEPDFSLDRDPFRPVGYRAPQPDEQPPVEYEPVPTQVQVSDPEWPALKLRGFSKTPGGGMIAFLDEIGIVQVGDIVQLQRGPWVFLWRIDEISEQAVRYRRKGFRPATPRKAAH